MKLRRQNQKFEHLCPCGSAKTYSTCCGPFIQGKQLPPTPEALMRSRYAAYTQANTDYIAKTMKEPAAKDFNPENTGLWARQVTWLGLRVIDTPPTTNNDTCGYVEFIARYRSEGQTHDIHEISEFQRENGRWYYVDHKKS